ncbi:MAG: hypothetical protein ACPLW7_01275 [Minisyncoccia bacterium]|jgi:uncharacterized protein YwgA
MNNNINENNIINDKAKLLNLLRVLNIKASQIKPESNNEWLINNFDIRLKIQKIVYLLKYITKEFNYDFSLYLRGPYSPELAKDYFSITDENIYGNPKQVLSNNSINIVNDLKSKDNIWLEVASTIILMYSYNENWEIAVKMTKEFKDNVLKENGKNQNYVDQVFLDLKNMKIIQ